jgi:hypothetical protein
VLKVQPEEGIIIFRGYKIVPSRTILVIHTQKQQLMKKIYTLLFLSGVAVFSFAQSGRKASATFMPGTLSPAKNSPVVLPLNTDDTLTNHWDLIGPTTLVDTPVVYNSGSGFVGGQNNYGDIGKAQRFDASYGVTQGGTINNILLWFGAKTQIAGTASYTATVWADASGKPGAVLGSSTFTIAQIDTSTAATKLIGTIAGGIEGAYNMNVAFSPRINIPSNQIFWAGITFSYANGDSSGLYSSYDFNPGDAPGATGNFLAAQTHTFDLFGAGGGWNSVNDGTSNTWQLDIAWGIFPVVTLGNTSVNENTGNVLSSTTAPNPAIDQTTIKYVVNANTNVTVSVYTITGEKVFSSSEGMQAPGEHAVKLDVSSFNAGMYFYSVETDNGTFHSSLSVVK